MNTTVLLYIGCERLSDDVPSDCVSTNRTTAKQLYVYGFMRATRTSNPHPAGIGVPAPRRGASTSLRAPGGRPRADHTLRSALRRTRVPRTSPAHTPPWHRPGIARKPPIPTSHDHEASSAMSSIPSPSHRSSIPSCQPRIRVRASHVHHADSHSSRLRHGRTTKHRREAPRSKSPICRRHS